MPWADADGVNIRPRSVNAKPALSVLNGGKETLVTQTYRYEPDVKIRPPASVATFSDNPCLMDTSCTNLVTSCWMLESSFSLCVSWRFQGPSLPNLALVFRLELVELDQVGHECCH